MDEEEALDLLLTKAVEEAYRRGYTIKVRCKYCRDVFVNRSPQELLSHYAACKKKRVEKV